MDPATRRLIEAIHAASPKAVLALTGGGTQAAAHLLNVPGGSRTILEILVPYSEQALADFLGRRPESFCSPETAAAMADRALERARWLAPGEAVVGLGCTASLVSDRPKRGDHRCHIATANALGSACYSLTLTKGARDRETEEAVVDALILNALAEAFGVDVRLAPPLLPSESVQVQRGGEWTPLERFLVGELATVCIEADGRARADAAKPAVLLPGSFNPVHAGHRELARIAAQRVGEAAFELSITNVDKPALGPEEVRRRIAQHPELRPLWLTRAPTFAEKALLFPGTVFMVGVDTAIRLVDPRYYHGSPERMMAAFESLRSLGCRFLVAGRIDAGGRFVELQHVAIPTAFRDLFEALSESEFRVDLSSTQLRQPANSPPIEVEQTSE